MNESNQRLFKAFVYTLWTAALYAVAFLMLMLFMCWMTNAIYL